MILLNTQKIVDTEIAADFEQTSAETVCAGPSISFPRVALACSFQAEESVLIDMMHLCAAPTFVSSRWMPAGSTRKPTTAWTRSAAVTASALKGFSRNRRKFKTWCGRTASIFSTTRSNSASSAVPCAKSSRCNAR